MTFNALIPELIVSDLDRSRKFYLEVLNFTFEYEREGFLFLSREGAQLMLEQQKKGVHPWYTGKLERPYGRGINLQIEVSDIAPLIQALEKVRHKIELGPEVHWYVRNEEEIGCEELLIQDLDGYLLRFSHCFGSRPRS